ncbi:MAG TPA: alcohol dehydrogenase catalytic domain-containing protein [Planctomycetota bacterium]|nr:alcohol dehydrogenase catalytic domain-containing protein [Planctomycetota bacterium]
MKAAYVKAPYQFQVRNVNLPKPGPRHVLVRVKSCGVCGTDAIHIAGQQAADWQAFGHEIAGVVEAVGDDVTHVKKGDRVALESSSFCRSCSLCRNGRVDLCNRAPGFWNATAMGFAEKMLAPIECVVQFDGLDFDAACLAEPLGVAIDLVKTAEIGLDDNVLVIGPGPIGLMALALARRQTAGRIFLAGNSHSKARMKLGRKLGADELIETDKTPLAGVDLGTRITRVLDTAPPQTLQTAIKAAATGAVIAYIGIEYGQGATVSFDANEFHFKKLQLRASFASPALYFPMALEFLKLGRIEANAFISHRFPLDRIEDAVCTAAHDKAKAVKVIVNP